MAFVTIIALVNSFRIRTTLKIFFEFIIIIKRTISSFTNSQVFLNIYFLKNNTSKKVLFIVNNFFLVIQNIF